MEIVVKQWGHSFVAGSAAGAGASAFFLNRFIFRIIRKRTKATMRKLMIRVTKSP
jgi:hypothetical protein